MDILVIIGCVALGYWIISSIMGPGIDITRQPPEGGKAPSQRPHNPGATLRPAAPRPQTLRKVQRPPDPVAAPQRAWPRPASPNSLQRPRASTSRRSTVPSAASIDDWYLVLDVPRSATRREIEAEFQRQLRKARDARDAVQQERLKRARDAGMKEAGLKSAR